MAVRIPYHRDLLWCVMLRKKIIRLAIQLSPLVEPKIKHILFIRSSVYGWKRRDEDDICLGWQTFFPNTAPKGDDKKLFIGLLTREMRKIGYELLESHQKYFDASFIRR